MSLARLAYGAVWWCQRNTLVKAEFDLEVFLRRSLCICRLAGLNRATIPMAAPKANAIMSISLTVELSILHK